MSRAKALERIARNIREHGFHQYLVQQSTIPRFAYTIGLRESLRAELILAGAVIYMADEVKQILNTIGRRAAVEQRTDATYEVEGLGSFTMRRAHPSWSRSLLLGAFDYYQTDVLQVYQLVPDEAHWTIDVPNLEKTWSRGSEPVWEWLHGEAWSWPVPQTAEAATNLDALRGARITEAMRWEEDYWEMFAGEGPGPLEDTRVVPLGTLVASDPTLSPVLDLALETGLLRDEDDSPTEWRPWGKRGSAE